MLEPVWDELYPAEIETLTIRIPMQLQRRGGRKLIMAPEGATVPPRKPARDETLDAAHLGNGPLDSDEQRVKWCSGPT